MFELISAVVLLILGFLGLIYGSYALGEILFCYMPPFWMFVSGWLVAGLLVAYFVRSPP